MQRQTCVLLGVTLCSAFVGQVLIVPRSIACLNGTRGIACESMEVHKKITIYAVFSHFCSVCVFLRP